VVEGDEIRVVFSTAVCKTAVIKQVEW
jgi:hypothetical protein